MKMGVSGIKFSRGICGVEPDETHAGPAEMAQRRVGKIELLADGHRQDADDVPVDEIEDVGEE